MYQLGHRFRHHYLKYAAIGVVVLGLLGGGLLASTKLLSSNTILHQSTAIISNVPVSSTKTQYISLNPFAIDLPATWKTVSHPGSPAGIYTWQGTVGEDTARWIDIYIDQMPANFAANRLLPVQVTGDHLELTGLTSDNCANFTDKSTEDPKTGTAPAKWTGVDFICDLGNYERDVVAIGTTDGVNQIAMVGPTAGSHRILLAYTDNSASPDYTIFSEAVKTFQIL